MRNIIFVVIVVIIIVGGFYLSNSSSDRGSESMNMGHNSGVNLSGNEHMEDGEVEGSSQTLPQNTRPFGSGKFSQLRTNTEKTSIDFNLVFGGGPGKDGIPSIDEPKFISINEAKTDDDTQGVLVEFDGEKRFYPYGILIWHEIVNDQIGDQYFSVTFCPLCGSAIVFDRNVNGQILDFGVSGLLYESNLLMYDRHTESLWSQARGESVIGDFLGTKLDILPMQLITFAELKANHPDSKVLSRNTGHIRQYGRNPYAGYEDRESTIFPVSVSDKRFPAKEVMYVVPFNGKSYVFPQLRLNDGQEISIDTESGTTLIAKKSNGEIVVTESGNLVPGYFEMWFSWATHHQEDGVVWDF